MTNLKTTALAILALATVVTASFLPSIADAQQAGPQGGFGGPGGGPGGQGGPGGGMRMRPMGGPALLLRGDVQKELKLTQEQIQRLRAIIPTPGGPGGRGGQGGPGGPPQGGGQGVGGNAGQGGFAGSRQGGQGGPPQGGQGGPGGPPQGGPGGQAGGQQLDNQIKQILNDNQFRRWRELDLQFVGAPALARPDVAERVGLNQEQVQSIRQILEQNRPPQGGGQGGPGGPPQGGGQGGPPQGGGQGNPPRGGGQGGPGGPPQGGPGGPGQPPNPGQMDQRRQELERRILAVLTSQQRQAWEQMKGQPFKFQPMDMPPRPGGGGQGGPGGQGGSQPPRGGGQAGGGGN